MEFEASWFFDVGVSEGGEMFEFGAMCVLNFWRWWVLNCPAEFVKLFGSRLVWFAVRKFESVIRPELSRGSGFEWVWSSGLGSGAMSDSVSFSRICERILSPDGPLILISG